jgi:hypothetical protein
MNNFSRIRKISVLLIPALLLYSCNFSAANPAQSPAAATPGIGTSNPTKISGLETPAISATDTTAAGTASSCATSADGALRLCFLDLSDGQTLAADPGVPIRISAEASGAIVSGISLSTDLGGYA